LGLLLLLVSCEPVPKRYLGVGRGDKDAPLLIEEFGDFQCPYCKQAWPVVEQVLSYYGPSKIRFYFTYPLWLHHQAWDLALTAEVVRKYNESAWFDWGTYMFANQDMFLNSVWFNQTQVELYQVLSGVVSQFGIDSETFYSAMNDTSTSNYATNEIHLGILRQVLGTPTFLVNGFIDPQLSSSTTFDEWVDIIDKLLGKDE